MQQLNPSEISEIIKSRIAKLDTSTEARNEGTVVSVSDGIVRIHGLADVMFGEMIEFEGGIYGMALNLEQDSVGAVVLGDYLGLAEGQKVRCTGRILEVPVGPELLGRVVDALGNPIDGKGPSTPASDAVEKVAPGVIWRRKLTSRFRLATRQSIPALIGRGQRELIIGDRRSVRPRSRRCHHPRRTGVGVSTLRLARSSPPLPTWCASWKSTVPWITPSSLPLPLPIRLPCSSWPRLPAAPWANTSRPR